MNPVVDEQRRDLRRFCVIVVIFTIAMIMIIIVVPEITVVSRVRGARVEIRLLLRLCGFACKQLRLSGVPGHWGIESGSSRLRVPQCNSAGCVLDASGRPLGRTPPFPCTVRAFTNACYFFTNQVEKMEIWG